MQYSRVALRLSRVSLSKNVIATTAVRHVQRNLHVQTAASLYTVGYDRLKYSLSLLYIHMY